MEQSEKLHFLSLTQQTPFQSNTLYLVPCLILIVNTSQLSLTITMPTLWSMEKSLTLVYGILVLF